MYHWMISPAYRCKYCHMPIYYDDYMSHCDKCEAFERHIFEGRDPTAAYHRGNEQSREAWKSLSPDTLSGIRKAIYDHIKASGGATCEEVERVLGISHQTASARCTELKKYGCIEPRGMRKTSSGRNAAIYRVSE